MMGHVGNDVVDLCDPHIAGHFERSRFVARVCDAGEVARVAASDDPHRLLWSLFAAKEAGYKVLAKMTPGIAFSPRRFLVDAASTRVTHDQLDLWLHVTHGPEWVHAIAGHGEGEPVWAVERRDAATGESAAARDLAVRLAAGRLGLAPETLTVDREPDRRFRDALAPPAMLQGGQRLALDVSLSHDGPWVACALLQISP